MTALAEHLAGDRMRHGVADFPAPVGTPIGLLADVLRRTGFVWFLADLAQLPENLTQATPDEEAAAAAYPSGIRRDGWLARRRLARHVLAEASGQLRPEDLRIGMDALGRPEYLGAATGWHLSFAARGPLAMIGIGQSPLGIDLEIEEEGLDIPFNVLRPDERAWLAEQPEPLRVAAFCRIWTAKEAIAKALGTGFRIPPEDIALPAAGTSHVDIRKFGESPVCENENRLVHDLLVLTRDGIRVFVSRHSGVAQGGLAGISVTVACARMPGPANPDSG